MPNRVNIRKFKFLIFLILYIEAFFGRSQYAVAIGRNTRVDCAKTSQCTKIIVTPPGSYVLQLESGIRLPLLDAVFDGKVQEKETQLPQKRVSPNAFLTAAPKRLQLSGNFNTTNTIVDHLLSNEANLKSILRV
jgi:hypothetical protein